MLSRSLGFNFFVHASTLQTQLGEHVEDGRPTFAHLNYQVLVTECERMVAILDRAIAERYSSGTVQKQHIESLGLGEDPVRVLEARIAEREMTRIALQEQWGQIASRPLPLQRLLEEIPDSPVASEGFLLALCSVFDPAIRQRLALLRDNILLGHVDVGVILQLFAPSAVARLEGRRFFEPEGSLQDGFTPYVRARIDGSAYFSATDSIVLAGRVRVGTIQGIDRFDLAPSRIFVVTLGWAVAHDEAMARA